MAHSTHTPRTTIRILTIVTGGIIAAAVTLPMLQAGAGEPAPTGPATFEVTGADTAQTELAEWALGRFEAAGLELPSLIISFHDADGCGGASGRYRPGSPAEVHLCIPEERPEKTRKLITLHELGHAWAENRTTDTTRAAFLQERGIDSWHNPDQPPHLWGAEHAAETISWALMDESVRIIRINNSTPERLTESFQVLTGSDPLNGTDA